MVDKFDETHNLNDENNQPNEQHSTMCQKIDDDEEVAKNNTSANNFIEFNDVKVYCDLNDDQLDSNDSSSDQELLDQLFDENGNVLVDQLNNLEFVISALTRTNDSNRFRLADKLLNLIQADCLIGELRGLAPILVQLIHPTKADEDDQSPDELCLQTRKYAIDAFDELLKRTGKSDEQKVNDLLNQLRYFCSDLHKLKLNKQNDLASTEFQALDLTIVEHPIEAICNLMKISFDEHYRNLISKLGGIEAIAEVLNVEHRYHGFLLADYDQVKQRKLKCDQSSIKIDEKWINSNCITLRRYTAMALTNLTFGDKQSKIQLCLDFNFLESLLAQLSCSFCEELIQVTSSVLRNLSWKASKICKAILSELNAAAILMYCSMQIKKETTLKCILYALWNLSSHNMLNKQKICDVDGSIKFLISLLEYRSANSTLTIVENTSGVIKNISSFIIKHDHLRKILRINNCHELLLKQLRSTSLTIVCNSVGILWNVSKDNLLDQKILINLGAISMLKNLTFSKHKIIAIASKETLKNLLTSDCLSNDFDLELISFKAFSMDCLTRSSLLTQRKRMLLKRELKSSLKEVQSTDELLTNREQNQKLTNSSKQFDPFEFNQLSQSNLSNVSNGQQSINNSVNGYINGSLANSAILLNRKSSSVVDVLDVSQSASDYFSDLYKDNSLVLNENYTIENLLQGLNGLKETNLDTILSNEFYLNTNPNMINSVSFFPGYLQADDESKLDAKRSSMYSTISEPIMYYDDNDQFTFGQKNCNLNEEILEEEYRKLTKLSINNDFNLYDSSSIFHAYPVIIQESVEFKDDDLDGDLYNGLDGELNANKLAGEKQFAEKQTQKSDKQPDRNVKSLNSKKRSNGTTSVQHTTTYQTRIPVPVQQIVKSQQQIKPKQQKNQTKEINSIAKISQIKNLKTTVTDAVRTAKHSLKSSKLPKLPRLTKSKTMEKNLNINTRLPKSRTTDYLCNRTYELTNDDLDEINDATENDAAANDLTYNVDEKRHNVTYILPSSESDRTLKNEQQQTETEHTLVPDNEDEKTDRNLDELNTYVQNLSLDDHALTHNDEDDEDATLHINESNENLNLVGDLVNGELDRGTELTDSIFVGNNIESARPPKIYHQINYSVASSLNNSFFTSDELSTPAKKDNYTSNDSVSSSKSSRLRSPKAKVFDLSASPPTNTFTITKSTRSNRSKDVSKDQALSTSGYQTSLNSSLLSNNSIGAIDKINPPSILNQISGISSLNHSGTDCMSTCESISSINSEIYDLSANGSLNSSFANGSFKRSTIKTSTPKHSANRQGSSKIAKPVTRIASATNPQSNQPSKTDTFRKNKTMKKSNTSSVSSASSAKSNQSTASSKAKSAPLKKASNQENARTKKTISTSKSMSRISYLPSASDQQAKKTQSKLSSLSSSLWKKTVSNQQNISSKVFKKKSTSSLDKKDRNSPADSTPNSLTRSSTFEKLPTTNQEAIKLSSSINANKSKIRPIELQRERRPIYH